MDMEFQDHLPLIAQRLGIRGLLQELEKGFCLLADPSSRTITQQSLKQSTLLLGMDPMSDSELRDIISLGDPRGRGELDLLEFCATMISLSPALTTDRYQALATVVPGFTPDDRDD